MAFFALLEVLLRMAMTDKHFLNVKGEFKESPGRVKDGIRTGLTNLGHENDVRNAKKVAQNSNTIFYDEEQVLHNAW